MPVGNNLDMQRQSLSLIRNLIESFKTKGNETNQFIQSIQPIVDSAPKTLNDDPIYFQKGGKTGSKAKFKSVVDIAKAKSREVKDRNYVENFYANRPKELGLLEPLLGVAKTKPVYYTSPTLGPEIDGRYTPFIQALEVDPDSPSYVGMHEYSHAAWENLFDDQKEKYANAVLPANKYPLIGYEDPAYLTTPTESYARRNVFFKEMGIDQSKKMTDKDINDILNLRKFLINEGAYKGRKELMEKYQNAPLPASQQIEEFLRGIKPTKQAFKTVFNDVVKVNSNDSNNAQYGQQFREGGKNKKKIEPTMQDSIALYNNTKSLVNYYSEKNGYEFDYYNQDPPGIINMLQEKKRVEVENKKKNKETTSTDSGSRTIDISEYYKKIDENKFQQRELANSILDTKGPMGLYDNRISPHGRYKVINKNGKNKLLEGDIVDIPMYDPIAIKPYSLLNPFEKVIRDKLYPQPNTPKTIMEKTSSKIKPGEKGFVKKISKLIQPTEKKPKPNPDPVNLNKQRQVIKSDYTRREGLPMLPQTLPQPTPININQQGESIPPVKKKNWHYAGAFGAVWDENGKQLTEEEMQQVKSFRKGGKYKCQTGGMPELEKGEVYMDESSNIQKISDYAPTHEEGGVPVEDVERVLEDTSTRRKDRASKILLIPRKEAKNIIGFDPKKDVSHSELFEKGSKKIDKQLKRIKLEDNFKVVKNDGDKFSNNSLDMNLLVANQLTEEKKALFDTIFNHQEEVKQKYNINNNEKAKYGYNKKYGLLPDGSFGELPKAKTNLNETQGLLQDGTIGQLPPSLGFNNNDTLNDFMGNTTDNGQPILNQPQPNQPFVNDFNIPLTPEDLFGPTMAVVDSFNKQNVNYNPIDLQRVQLKRQSVNPALQNAQSDYNAALRTLPNNQIGYGNAASLFSKKYNIDNQTIGQYENINSQIDNQEVQANQQINSAQQQSNQQARNLFSDRIATRDETARLQRLKGLDDIYTRILENRKLNREGDLILQQYPNFNQTGQFNGNRYNVQNSTGIASNSQQGSNDFKAVLKYDAMGNAYQVIIGPDGKLLRKPQLITKKDTYMG